MSPRWLARRTWRRLRQGKAAFVGLTLAFAAVAALAAAARALARQSAREAVRLADHAHVIAYLEPGWNAERRDALQTALGRLPGVREVRAIDGATALADLRREMKALRADPAPLAVVEPDFLPASLEIRLDGGPDLQARVKDTARRLERQSGIAAVDAMAEGLDRAAAFGALSNRLARLAGGGALLAMVVLLGGLLLHERRRRRGEARTLTLLGADALALHLPAGSLAALAAIAGGAAGLPLGSRLADLLLQTSAARPAAPGSETALYLLAFALAGLLVGWLSVPRAREPVA